MDREKKNPPGGVVREGHLIGAGDRGAGAPIGGCETWKAGHGLHTLVAGTPGKVHAVGEKIKNFRGAGDFRLTI